MGLDRQSIEKRDFPIGRRGYDPEAVDAHLSLLADELEGLKRASRTSAGVATAASEQVRLIVEAAEQSAGDIERDADLEARRIRQDARDAAEKVRADSSSQAREHVSRVAEASQSMVERLDNMEIELRSTLESLRASAARLTSDLALLQGTVAEVRSVRAGGFEPDEEPEAAAATTEPADSGDGEPTATQANGSDPDGAQSSGADRDAKSQAESGADQDSKSQADGQPREADADEEGARLIALNMALNGSPREEVEIYLTENYKLTDAGALLDDVYARAG